MEYRVIWEIDVDARSPREAAKHAKVMMVDRDTTATVFCVTNKRGRRFTVDLRPREFGDGNHS